MATTNDVQDTQLQKIEINIETITPDAAKEYLKTNLHNRKTSEASIAFYADQMTRGQWMLSPQGLSFDKFGMLLDGQHRLLALIRSNTKQRFVVARGFDRDTFKTIDTGKMRSGADILSIEDIQNSHLLVTGIRKFMTLKMGKRIRESNKQLKLSNADFLEAYENDREFFKSLARSASRMYGRMRLFSAAEILGYVTYLVKVKGHSLEKAQNFFEELTNSSTTHAINDLRAKIFKSKTSNVKLTADQKEAFLILAWNSYISGEQVEKLKYSPKDEFPQFI